MIKREELIQTLQSWVAADIGELAVWEWGEQAKSDGAFECELVSDLVGLMAALPYEMLVVEDVEVFLDALANPLHETDLSINLLWNHMDMVDVDTRREQYREHAFYGQFYDAD